MGEALSTAVPMVGTAYDEEERGRSSSASSEEALRQQQRLRALGAEDLSSLTYFAFSLQALFEGMAQRIRCGDAMVGTLEGLVRRRNTLELTGQLGTPAGAALLVSIGFLRCLQRDPKGALREYAQALEIRERTSTMETADGAFLLTAAGISKCASGDSDGAAASFSEAFRVRELTSTLETLDGAMLWTCIGFTRFVQQDLPGCIKAYQTARDLREQLGALDTVDGARLLTNLGAACLENGQTEDSLRMFKEARAIRVRIGELETLDGARLLVNIGAAEFVCGNRSRALEVNIEARWTLERADGADSRDLAGLAANVGLSEHMLGHLGRARDAYEESLRRLEAHGAEKSQAAGRVLMSLALAHMEEGEPEEALVAYYRAREAYDEVVLEVPWSTDLLSTVAAWREEVGDVQGTLDVLEHARALRRRAKTLGTTEGLALQKQISILSERRASLPAGKLFNSHESDGDEETCASEQDRHAPRAEAGVAMLAWQAKACAQPRTISEMTAESEVFTDPSREPPTVDEWDLAQIGEEEALTISI